MRRITKSDLFNYFRGTASESEIDAIDAWLGEDEANARIYKEASLEYEMLVMNGQTAGKEEVRRKKRGWRIVLGVAANAAAAVLIFFLAQGIGRHNVTKELENSPVSVSAPLGQRLELTLSDGSVVNLNAGSSIEYPALFRGGERNVRLRGEALFDVRHDEAKPFIVNTSAAKIQVTGTRFNVLADEETEEFAATLIEGKVQVTSGGQTIVLSPDQKAVLKDGKLHVETVEAEDAALWTEGIIDITGADFLRLIRRMEKAYGVKIVIERDDIPSIGASSGKIRVSDGIDHAMGILSQLSDFEFVKDEVSGTVHIR